eukprot:IDg2669t1
MESVYIDLPHKIRTDRGSVFTSKLWEQLTKASDIELKLSGVESHNSLGAGERYHGHLRRIYFKIKESTPNTSPEIMLRYAVKTMKDTVGTEGLVPSLLVFGSLPRIPGDEYSKLPNRATRMRALAVARKEIETIVANLRVTHALRAQILQTAIFVENNDGAQQHFKTVNVRPYIEDDTLVSPSAIQGPLVSAMSPPLEIRITEVHQRGNSMLILKEVFEARRKEIRGLVSKREFRAVSTASIPKNASILSGRFLDAIKNPEIPDELYRS